METMGTDIHISIEYKDPYFNLLETLSCDQFNFGRNSEIFDLIRECSNPLNIEYTDTTKECIETYDNKFGFGWLTVKDLEHIKTNINYDYVSLNVLIDVLSLLNKYYTDVKIIVWFDN